MAKGIKKEIKWVVGSAVGVAVLVSVLFFISQNNQPNPLDSFAQCLNEKGAKFYGAFWCPHCQTQKAEFGSAQKYLPYIECSTPDGQSQLKICQEAGITGYPTWIFPDGSRIEGRASFAQLSNKSGCTLPAEASN